MNIQKIKSLTLFVAVVGILSACGVNDLEDRLDNLENSLGTNEPLAINFTTTNDDGLEINENASYLFKPKGLYYNYIEDNQDGTYYVYIERYADVEGSESAWIEFYYDETTGEVTNPRARIYFYDQFQTWINPRFGPNYTGNTFTLNLKSINVETGAIDLEIDAASDETGTYNEYEGQPMTCTFKFKGKLDKYIWD